VSLSDICHNIIVHILNKGNIFRLDFMLMQDPPYDISSHFVIDLLQVNEDDICRYFFYSLYLSISCLVSPRHKTKLVFGDIGHSLK
jgi:hypothetical protein